MPRYSTNRKTVLYKVDRLKYEHLKILAVFVTVLDKKNVSQNPPTPTHTLTKNPGPSSNLIDCKKLLKNSETFF